MRALVGYDKSILLGAVAYDPKVVTIWNALTVLAGRSTEDRALARGHEAFRELLETMHLNRIRRLGYAGFTPEQAELISELHTPNFM